MAQHVKILGILHIVFSSLCILAGVLALVVMGGIAGIVGMQDQSADTQEAVPILAIIGGVACIVLMILGLPGLIGGIGLISYKPWARIIIIVLSALDLLNIPIGTAIGVYGFWVLLNKETEALFNRSAVPVMP